MDSNKGKIKGEKGKIFLGLKYVLNLLDNVEKQVQ